MDHGTGSGNRNQSWDGSAKPVVKTVRRPRRTETIFAGHGNWQITEGV
jgi:hypothetical protein